jgi:hydroxymethylglutaryl-CoA reductase
MNQLAIVARPGHSTLPPAARPRPLPVTGLRAAVRVPAALPPAVAAVARPKGVYPGSFGFALNVALEDGNRLVPVAAESAAALAPLAEALRLVRRSGGFEVKRSRVPMAELRLLFEHVADVAGATPRIQAAARDLLSVGLEARGEGGPVRDARVALEVRSATTHALAVHLSVDGTSSAHEVLLERVAARLGPALRGLIAASARSEIHYILRRRVLARCRVALVELVPRLPACVRQSPERARAAIRQALSWLAAAEDDAELASAQNEVVLGNVARVAEALGRDRQRIIAEGHDHASRFGRAQPLASFTLEGEHIIGSLELPLGLDSTERRRDRGTDLANALVRGESIEAIGLLSACLGLAAHLATLVAVTPLALASPPRARPLPPPRARRSPEDSGVHRTVRGRRSLPPPPPRRRECG